MKKLNSILSLVLALTLVLCLAACGGSTSSSAAASEAAPASSEAAAPASEAAAESTAASGEQLRIAFIVKTLNNPFFVDMETGAKEHAEKVGIDLIFQDPEKETDIEKQIQMMDNMIVYGVDGIILAAAGGVELIPSIVKATDAGIPVVLVNDNIDFDQLEAEGGEYVTFVGVDQYTAALNVGDYVAENFADGAKVAILDGPSGVPALEERVAGFVDPLLEVDAIEIVAQQPAGGERDKGFNVTQNILTTHPDLTVLIGDNDQAALGAIEAIEQAGLSDQISVFGFDATDDGKAAVDAGQMVGTVAQYPGLEASESIDAIIAHINGETVEKQIMTKTDLYMG